MRDKISKCLNQFEIDFHNSGINDEFYKASRQLVTILFAVVLGVGLSELASVETVYGYLVLLIVYFAIFSSWWGYHCGIIAGPIETNLLNYIIDCALLINYWYLINRRDSLETTISAIAAMYALYFLWELVRLPKQRPIHEREKIIEAARFNLLFLLLFVFIIILYNLFPEEDLKDWVYIFVLAFLLISYRREVHAIYTKRRTFTAPPVNVKEEDLIEKAKAVSKYARAYISKFSVGAAILSDTGNVYVGCNVEFDNYTNTIHAEESALSSFVSAGERIPICVAIYTSGETIYFPCGLCRQSLFEIGGSNLKVIACNDKGHHIRIMSDLLPHGFRL